MNAIEIKGLKKSFRGMYALNGLNMTVPVGSIYGFIGEIRGFGGDLLHDGGDHPAGAAPGSPEVQHYLAGGLQNLFFEIVFGNGDNSHIGCSFCFRYLN